MRILSIDSSLGTQLAVVDTAPTTDGSFALQVLSQDEQADTRRHAESPVQPPSPGCGPDW